MWNEHFGIGIVEMMAAGLLVVAHDSGGPRADIIATSDESKTQWTGYRATTVEQYADALYAALSQPTTLTCSEQQAIRNRARNVAVTRFSDQIFAQRMVHVLRETELVCLSNQREVQLAASESNKLKRQ
jgi:alpha-1,2-mannosyltransferase